MSNPHATHPCLCNRRLSRFLGRLLPPAVHRPLWFTVFVLATMLACTLPGGFSLTGGTATPPPSPTPPGDFIEYQVPIFSAILSPGETVPGTQLQYVSRINDGYNVTIDGLPAVKRAADSLPWRGIIGPGVTGQYDLRLVPQGDRLLATGPVRLTVLSPVPVQLPGNTTPAAPLHFENIIIAYSVPVLNNVPGTTLIYLGETPDGGEFGGTTGYPFVKQGDSLVWLGQLRDNVFVRYNLRVASYNPDRISLAGTAELWLRPAGLPGN